MTTPARAAAGGVRPGAARRRYAGLAAACGLAVLGAGCGTSTSAASSASSSASPSGGATASAAALSPAARKALAAKYLAIAQPANHSLDVEVDGYGDAEHDDLAQARKDLLGQVATEKLFDSQVLAIRFPAAIEHQVQALITANQARIQLTRLQAQSTTLASLRAFDSRHNAANAAVEAPVRQIRRLLGLPPPSTS